MKTVLRSATIFFAFFCFARPAFSCPNLSGTYFCNANPSHPDMLYTFSQIQFGSDWSFKVQAELSSGKPVSEFSFVTDGKEQDVIDAVSGNALKVTASCDADALTVTGLAALNKPKPIHFSEILSLTSAGDLSDISVDITGATIHEICVRK